MRIDILTGVIGRLRGLPAPVVDGALAVAFAAIVAAERLREPLDGDRTVASLLLTLVLAGTLWWRRRAPLTAFLVASVALCAESLLHVATAASPYASLIVTYSLGRYATPVRARWGLPVLVASVLVFFAGTPDAASFEPIGVLFGWLAAWVIGSSTARRLEDQDRARRAIRSQVEAEERTRMARELHDVIGHTVNLLIVQAGAARLSLEKDPELARRLLATMEDTGRAALSDLDQVLGTLRPEPAGPRAGNGWSPSGSPGLAQLPDLVDRLTASGVDVTLRVEDAVGLPRNLDLSAYRIVQEALTNTLKYAAPCAATVLCSRSGRDVVVEVSDNGPGPARRHRPGRGLLGITERVSMCGGTLEHGAGARGGFTVRAVLPLP